MLNTDEKAPTALPGKIFLIILSFILLAVASSMAQTKEEKKLRVKAVKALNSGDYAEAIDIYEDLLKLDSENPDYNYEMGLAIMENGVQKGNAVRYLRTAIANVSSDTLPDLFLYAGMAEQYDGNFEKAIQHYDTYLSLIAGEGLTDEELGHDVGRYIEMSQNALVQVENEKKYIQIINLGPSINSEYPDYSPVVKEDESLILFTSRRPNSTGGAIAGDNKYFEDIYYSLNINGAWSEASNYDSSSTYMNDQINTPLHDATVTYASDENQLLIYRESDVWSSKLEGGLWTIPVRAGGRINSARGFEPSVFITDDEQTMFVVSEIPSGFGGRDIYMTTKDDQDAWKPLKSLGRNINTRYDEDAPFLTKDGKTLYFSSRGHNSLGDYDIFKTTRDENGKWGEPENLGTPINTPGNDIYFVTSDEGAIGYYASDRKGGLGDMDIYRIILECDAVSNTTIRGRIFSEDRKSPVPGSVKVFDPSTGELFNEYMADAATGTYQMQLKTETRYAFEITAEGYLTHTGNFTVPKQCEAYTLYQEVKIDNVEDENGRVIAQRAFVNNAFFDVESKIQEDFEDIVAEKEDEEVLDSLSSIIASRYHPAELNNYVQLVDVRDTEGNILGSESIGERPVEKALTQEEVVDKYVAHVKEGDQHMDKEQYSESRVDYEIASMIKPEETYPRQQIEKVEKVMTKKDDSELLAKVPQPDTSRVFLPEDQAGKAAMASEEGTTEEQNADYSRLIAQGNEAFKNGQMDDAESAYKAALEVKNEEYPKLQLAAIEQQRAEEKQRTAMAAQEEASADKADYNTLIAQGDEAMASKDLDIAKAAYLKAADLSSAEYPVQQLKMIEEQEAAAQKEAEYNEMVAEADRAFAEGELETAQKNYEDALELMSRTYPQEQLDAIAEQRSAQALAESMDAKNEASADAANAEYDALIAQGDKAMASNDVEVAKAAYQKAAEMGSAEYPTQQIKAIEEREGEYNELIEMGDRAFADGHMEAARKNYEEALALMPKTYPKNQLAAIERQEEMAATSEQQSEGTEDMSAKTAEQKANEPLMATQSVGVNNSAESSAEGASSEYDAFIAAADKDYEEGRWKSALVNYEKAKNTGTSEYPDERIAAIQAEMKAREAHYAALMSQGAAAYDKGELDAAVSYYQQAQDISPDTKASEEIERIQDEQKMMAAKEAEYRALIATANAAYRDGKPDEAVANYKAAMKLTTDSYPADQIAAIEAERSVANAGESQADKTEASTKTEERKSNDEVIVFRNILFDFDKHDLREASIEELNKVYDYLSERGEINLQIDGHADWVGSVEYNLALSEKRAKAAYDYLMKKGISDAQMVYQYFGEAVPIAPNANPDGSDNPEGRQLNRRCEFKLDETGTAENVILKF